MYITNINQSITSTQTHITNKTIVTSNQTKYNHKSTIIKNHKQNLTYEHTNHASKSN